MKLTFKQKFWKIVKWSLGLFFLMLAFRIFYGYVATDISYTNDYTNDFFNSVANLRKNYASEKKLMIHDVDQQASFSASQKYEKTATVKAKSSQFESDETAIKKTAKDFEGVIQYEQNIGNRGSREIHLLIGIAPAKFDTFYLKIQRIGLIKSTEITKIDKTNEYRQLNAKRASLEKTLSSLNELKSKAGAITDYVSLHDKILEIETQLQELGVELGNFDTENEFCTIKFSLYEGATGQKISFLQRFKTALEWTIKYYAIMVFTLLGLFSGIFILLLALEKISLIQTVANRLKD